jgi:acid phosphatase (class A)
MKRGLAIAVLLALAGPADAALVDPVELDIAHLLPPPPAAGSDIAKAELAELHDIAAHATPAMLAAAAHDANDQKPDLFNATLGFDLTQYPATMALLREVGRENGAVQSKAKSYFHRDRPWVVDATIKQCVPALARAGDDSYPSGHSTYGFALGEVLAALMPARAQAILARSAEFAHNRMVCGYHFHSDIVGGQVFGTIIAVKLLANTAFQAEFAAAQTELKAAGKI